MPASRSVKKSPSRRSDGSDRDDRPSIPARLRKALSEIGPLPRLTLVMNVAGLLALLIALQVVFSEEWWTNLRFQARPAAPAVSSDLVMIALDEKYAEAHGRPERIATAYLARVLRAVTALEPAAVAVDVKVAPVDTSEAGFRALLDASRRSAPMVFPSLLMRHGSGYELALQPPDELLEAAHSGHVTFWGTGRRGSLGGLLDPASVIIYDVPLRTQLRSGEDARSFALEAVERYRARRPAPTAAGSGIRLGIDGGPAAADVAAIQSPDAMGQHGTQDEGSEIINYFGRVHRDNGVAYFSSEDFLSQTAIAAFQPEWIRDKLVVLGATFAEPTGFDTYHTPFGAVRGVEVHVNAINTLMTGQTLRRLDHPLWTVLISLILFAASLLAWHPRRRKSPVRAAAYMAGYVAVSMALFFWMNLLVPMAWPLWFGVLACILGFVFGGVLGGVPLPSTAPIRAMLRLAAIKVRAAASDSRRRAKSEDIEADTQPIDRPDAEYVVTDKS